MIDANTYYLNEHMSETTKLLEKEDRARYLAIRDMHHIKSDFYPWTADRMMEALNEASVPDLEDMASAHASITASHVIRPVAQFTVAPIGRF